MKFQAAVADKCTVTHTLLLADDSVTIQRVIELTFADEDVQVVAVSDGDQAIARLESAPPDIVLADIGMPGKNGYEVARYVKRSPKLSHIPVVLLTGAFEPVDQARAAEVGCDGVLAKPFEPQLVIGRVRELLAAEAAAAAASAPAAAPAADDNAPAPAELDDYFDRLDVAFAKLSAGGRQGGNGGREEPPASVADEIDRYVSEHHAGSVPELQLSPEPVLSVVDAAPVEPEAAPIPRAEELTPPPPVAEPVQPSPGLATPVTTHAADRVPTAPAPAAPTAFPSVADAFAAILASESRDSTSDKPGWPVFQPPAVPEPPPPAPLELTDAEVDRIVGLVLDRMSDRIVRETVTTIASDRTERLVREEIERIKNALK